MVNNEIAKLQPEALWQVFHQLTQIPRPSHHEAKVRGYLLEFAATRGLEAEQDAVGNILIRKPASNGREDRPMVTLQGHMDMVPQANSDSSHDFTRDPIAAQIDGDWVTADKTTLGADNGVGVAAILAVLASDTLQHGPLEALITSNEEDGMDGAFGLKSEVLRGSLLINTDSEDEGVVCIGCAGGANANTRLRYETKSLEGEWLSFKLKIGGLKGGHSGVDIHRGRGNAVALLFRLLVWLQSRVDFRLQRIDAGNLRNAIPREALVHIAIKPVDEPSLVSSVDEWLSLVSAEYRLADPTLEVAIESLALTAECMNDDTATALINAVNACPNGVLRMSDSMPGLVETSSNLAIVRADEGEAEIFNLVRSSVDSARDEICARIASLFSLIGATTQIDGQYPGWQPNRESRLLRHVLEVYQSLFAQEAEIGAIHAGLECGILGASHPDLEMISFGPTIRSPHSPDERVDIKSVHKFWQLLTGVLAKV